MQALVLVRGGGDLGTGVAVTLSEAGYPVVVVDLPHPTSLRLTATFAAAALAGEASVGGVRAVLAPRPADLLEALEAGLVPLWTGGEAELRGLLSPAALVDARMRGLTQPSVRRDEAPVVIALGPGYTAGLHATYVIETQRGPALGRVIGAGQASAYTGVPGVVEGFGEARLLRAPCDGAVQRVLDIGDMVEAGDLVARVSGVPVQAGIGGMVRGLKLDGTRVRLGHKLGDIDPRRDRSLLTRPSDKARRVAEGVREALERAGVRPRGAAPPTSRAAAAGGRNYG